MRARAQSSDDGAGRRSLVAAPLRHRPAAVADDPVDRGQACLNVAHPGHRLVGSPGGDADDTQGCMAGAIAEPFHGLPARVDEETRRALAAPLLDDVDRFTARSCRGGGST